MKHIITLLLVTIGLLANAQVKRTVHQTFELDEENTTVALDIYDDFEVEEWSSNNIMIITTAILESGAQHLLDFYVDQKGRYDIEKSGEEASMTLTSEDKTRLGMKYRGQVVYEMVNVKMYIPESYELKGKNKLVKKPEETETAADQ